MNFQSMEIISLNSSHTCCLLLYGGEENRWPLRKTESCSPDVVSDICDFTEIAYHLIFCIYYSPKFCLLWLCLRLSFQSHLRTVFRLLDGHSSIVCEIRFFVRFNLLLDRSQYTYVIVFSPSMAKTFRSFNNG